MLMNNQNKKHNIRFFNKHYSISQELTDILKKTEILTKGDNNELYINDLIINTNSFSELTKMELNKRGYKGSDNCTPESVFYDNELQRSNDSQLERDSQSAMLSAY
ncbi:hypothetical protein L3V82_01730 [Thiotrichales bacterium 19S3-7]|nr:hypothetical protein [Thiotrichales bacterium 19S3-7]MCF6800884.1 hypothetical protein [Thiotrichales bacterium 19S3-11]